MKRLVFFLFLVLAACVSYAQRADSLFVVHQDHGWAITHPVKAGETVFSLARRYHVPPAILADVNNLNYQSPLSTGSRVLIPLGAYNQLTTPPNGGEYRPIYYRVSGDDDLRSIARASIVSQRALQGWNGLLDNELHTGQILKVGWVLYDNTNLQPGQPKPASSQQPLVIAAPKPATSSVFRPRSRDTIIQIIQPPRDTADVDTIAISAAETEYLSQTYNGQSVHTEKGPVAFYGSKTGNNSFFYAFHNTASKGTIIKVHNPGTGKTIFVKVLGPMPETRLYHNSVLGINAKARAALGVTTEKAWCELSYAP